MFKSIEYRLTIYLFLLIATVSITTWLFIEEKTIYWTSGVVIAFYFLSKLNKQYRKFNSNIIFLLNALDNGDYTYNFTENSTSKREKEINHILNRIREILSRARQDVIENEKFLSLIMESVNTGILIVDDRNIVQIANKAAMNLLGMEILTHLNQLKMIDPSFPEIFGNLDTNKNSQISITNERERIEVMLSMSKITINRGELRIIAINSIGNELEAKEMESWIKLIRVMTHEIMNSIAPITSLSDTMLESYSQTDANALQLQSNTIEAFETINSTAKGLLSFVSSYRKFTGVPAPEPMFFEVQPFINSILNLDKSSLKGIKLETLYSKEAMQLFADRNQIGQVLVNLIKNAREALQGVPEPKIIVKVEQSGTNTRIEIWNNGNPIPKDIVPHIFIPFFTTKDSGTGIGLSLSRYIMRLHGGNLRYTPYNGWTIFQMEFQQ